MDLTYFRTLYELLKLNPEMTVSNPHQQFHSQPSFHLLVIPQGLSNNSCPQFFPLNKEEPISIAFYLRIMADFTTGTTQVVQSIGPQRQYEVFFMGWNLKMKCDENPIYIVRLGK